MAKESNKRHVILVSSPRCGTMHIANLYKQLFKQYRRGFAQHQGPLGNIVSSRHINTFDSDWSKSPLMYRFSREYPWLRWIIMYREMPDAMNSLHNFYEKKGHIDKDLPIEKLADKYWIQTYRKILNQLDALDPKPFFMRFKDYFAGKHDELLLDIYNLPKTQEYFDIIKRARESKANSYGEPMKFEFSPALLKNCNAFEEKLRDKCKNSWVEREVHGDEDLTSINPHYPAMRDMYKQKLFGAEMGQTFTALFVFEWILNNYPIEQIVEVGTGRGGLTAFLAFQSHLRGIPFVTYDARYRINDEINYATCNAPRAIKKYLTPHFRQKDVFQQETINEIAEIVKGKKTLFYCDNGRKPKEVRTYAPLLENASIIGTHDWNNQFAIDDVIKENNMQIIFEEFCETHRTRQRFWYKLG